MLLPLSSKYPRHTHLGRNRELPPSHTEMRCHTSSNLTPLQHILHTCLHTHSKACPTPSSILGVRLRGRRHVDTHNSLYSMQINTCTHAPAHPQHPHNTQKHTTDTSARAPAMQRPAHRRCRCRVLVAVWWGLAALLLAMRVVDGAHALLDEQVVVHDPGGGHAPPLQVLDQPAPRVPCRHGLGHLHTQLTQQSPSP